MRMFARISYLAYFHEFLCLVNSKFSLMKNLSKNAQVSSCKVRKMADNLEIVTLWNKRHTKIPEFTVFK